MKTKNGSDYAQNYDVIIKWLAGALRGQTLDVIGVKTGRIEEVFGFEPSDISVRAGRVDVMVRDDRGDLYHVEEQRNPSTAKKPAMTAATLWNRSSALKPNCFMQRSCRPSSWRPR